MSNSARTQNAFNGLPDFSAISASDIGPLTETLLSEARERVAALGAVETPGFDNFVEPFEELQHDVARRWSPISHLQMVCNTEAWQRAYLQALEALTAFQSELAQHTGLYRAFSDIRARLPESADDEQRGLLAHVLRDFELAGVGLDDDRKAQYRSLVQALSAAQATFASNLQRCTDQWHWSTDDEDDVAGIPDAYLAPARRAAERLGEPGWRFSLSQPTYIAILTHAERRSTRERFYRAWMTRATADGEHDPAYDNTPLITQILEHRRALAMLLGFDTYADYSLAPKMAGSVDEVTGFLDSLAARSRASAERELAELRLLAGHELAPWDYSFYSERLRERHYAIREDEVTPYFPAERVLGGLFQLASRLFGLTLERSEPPPSVWHPSVAFITLRDRGGQLLGGFYTDLYAREGKRAGAWIDECVIRKSLGSGASLPVGYLVCNFPPDRETSPSLLTHDQVVTLFHEFGHMLHHLLTRVRFPSIAGINGVPWDAVELPSQFLENFAWQYDVLARCSGHVETGEPLPRALFDKLTRARNAGAGLRMLRQLEFSLFDFRLHASREPATPALVKRVLADTRRDVGMIPVPDWAHFENGFTHIFAGGYAAGYYSYKWAEVLAADAFGAFSEVGDVFDVSTAERFRQHILEVGGSRDIQRAYVDFRGRAATIDALLAQHGIEAA